MLRNKHFLLLWVVNILTTMAVELLTITILVTVFEETGSTLQAAGAMVARTLPAFLLGPIAGVLVDRYPRKNVLIGMDVVRLLLIITAVFTLTSTSNIPVITIYIILTGISAADVFHRPARISLIPSLVTREQLVQANSFILASTQIMMAISFTLGGWLILVVPLQQIAMGIAGLFLLAVGTAVFMVIPKRAPEEEEKEEESIWQAFISGWQYLRNHPIARPLTIMETVEHLPHGIWTGALLLTFTVKALNGDAADFGIQTTGYFSGMILGSLAALAMSDWLRRYPGRIIVIDACLAGLLTLAFSTSQTVLISAILAFLFGPPVAVRDVAQDALLQGTVDEDQLGRVYATREMLRNVVFMFAGVFFAWLSDFVPIRTIYQIGGVMYVLTGLYALSNKPLRESKLTP